MGDAAPTMCSVFRLLSAFVFALLRSLFGSRACLVVLGGWFCGAVNLSFAGEPPAAPILCIEAGMHAESVSSIVCDPTGRMMLTCSHDKTARLWSLVEDPAEAGGFKATLLRTLRVPIGAGNDGKLYACALSPDGSLAAVGGWTGFSWDEAHSIYLFDTASGRMLRRLTELPNVVLNLAFSASGRTLAGVLSGEEGICVWDVGSGGLISYDKDYGDSCHGLDWLGDETLVCTSWDGMIRLYRDVGLVKPATFSGGAVPLSPACKVECKTGKKPSGIRFSPNGRTLAVGFSDSTAVAILAADDLRLLHQTPAEPTAHPTHSLSKVAWSRDGRHLAAGGGWIVQGQCPIRIWSEAGLGVHQDLLVGCTNTLLCLNPLPFGGFMFGTSDPAWGIVQNTPLKDERWAASEEEAVNALMNLPSLSEVGSPSAPGAPASGIYQKLEEIAAASGQAKDEVWRSALLGVPPGADHRMSPPRSQVSADASVVAFGYLSFGKVPATFSLSDRRLLQGKTPRRLHLPREDGLAITDWLRGLTPQLDGKPLKMADYETSRCIAVAPDASFFVQGSDWHVRCYTAGGEKLWDKPAPGVTWGVNLSSDGRILVALYGDGTVRWHRTDTGEELLAFFPHADRKRWVLWTPAGWYDCSAGGEKLIGWHVNRGKDREADFFPAEKFRDSFHRPDILDELIRTWDADAAVKLANARRGKAEDGAGRVEEVIAAKAPPVVELTVGGATHTVDLAAGAKEATLAYRVRDGGAPVTQMRVLVDGRPVDARVSKPDGAVADAKVTVPLPAHDCVVALLAGNGHAFSEPALVNIRHLAAGKRAAAATRPKGRLYILAVGVSQLKNEAALPGMTAVKHAATDARAFAAVLGKQTALYTGIEKRVLTEEEATASGIRDGLDYLRTNTKSGDTALVFLAGHGESDRQGRYTYCAHDYDRARRLQTGVGFEDIKSALGAAKSRVVLFLDAFSAGSRADEEAKVDVAGLVNSLSDSVSNIVVFASNDGRRASLESEKLKGGIFACGVKEGLMGKADVLHKGRITLSALQSYVEDEVSRLSDGQQMPVISIPKMTPNLTLGLVP